MPLKWGIMGVGKISHDFLTALKCNLTVRDHEVVAIASRSLGRSKEFAEKHNIRRFYGSYKDLLKDDEVEVVYIAVLNPFHHELCLLALNHGKHILCEKPFCMNSRQVEEVLDLAVTKGLFVMEGLWSRFFPVYKHLRTMIRSRNTGQVREVHIKHGFRGQDTDRVVRKDLGGGIVLDIGVYALQFVLFCFEEAPTSIKATGTLNPEGVDIYFEATLEFSEGRVAKIVCSGIDECDNQAVIVTSGGTICIPTYWCPTSIVEPDGNIRTWVLTDTEDEMHFTNSCGLRYEADEVKDCIRSAKRFSPTVPHREMLLISSLEDEIRRQIGVQYDCD